MFLNVPTSLAILSSFPPFTKSSSSQQRPGSFIVPGYPPFLPSKQLHTLICNFSIMVSLSFSFCYYPVFHSRKQRREKKGKKGRRGSGGGRREGRNKIPRWSHVPYSLRSTDLKSTATGANWRLRYHNRIAAADMMFWNGEKLLVASEHKIWSSITLHSICLPGILKSC